jgi:hypothetical protein
MSNWEPEEVADADLEGIAGGAGKGSPSKGKKQEDTKPMPGGGDAPDKTDPSKTKFSDNFKK